MEAGRPGRAVVVGVDGSPSALRAVCWAAAEAASRHALLRIVTLLHPCQDGRDLAFGLATSALAEAAHVAATPIRDCRCGSGWWSVPPPPC